jgi:hypothetical protein
MAGYQLCLIDITWERKGYIAIQSYMIQKQLLISPPTFLIKRISTSCFFIFTRKNHRLATTNTNNSSIDVFHIPKSNYVTNSAPWFLCKSAIH